jgi:hypothetical protein
MCVFPGLSLKAVKLIADVAQLVEQLIRNQ